MIETGQPAEPIPAEKIAAMAALPCAVVDAEGKLVHLSPAFEELVGFLGADLVGKPSPHPWWPPEDYGMIRAVCDLELRGYASRLGLSRYEASIRDKCERRIPVMLTHERILGAEGSVLHIQWYETRQPGRPDSPKGLLDLVLELRQQIEHGIVDSAGSDPASIRPELAVLSPREREVFVHLIDGAAAAAIATALCISPHTVRNHTKAIFRKLGVHSRVALVRRFGS